MSAGARPRAPVLWQPDAARIERSLLTAFARHLHASGVGPAAQTGDAAADYRRLHAWSVEARADFWSAFVDFSGLVAERGDEVLQPAASLAQERWFPGTYLNYAENLLAGPADDVVVIACDESGGRAEWTRAALRRAVAAIAAQLATRGVGPGAVVAGVLPNGIEALVAMLATASLGAAWTSTSPDFGAEAIIDRIGQARASVLFAVTGCRYGGRAFDLHATLAQVVDGVDSLRTVVLVPQGGPAAGTDRVEYAAWDAWLATDAGGAPRYRRVPFDAPLFVMYTSGTTGRPKAIVHGTGGSLLQHCKEHRLHADVQPGDRLFFFTTCGWMMWNWLASGLASGACLVLYDGSPTWPAIDSLWSLAARERVTHFGTSPRYLAALERAGCTPRTSHDLPALRSVLSTGAPLAPDQFRYVHDAIAADVHLASMSGGTDILGCFCLGVPWLPVRAGELQAAGLGMDVAVFDSAGHAVRDEQGELVCRRGFPSVPLRFLGDDDGRRFRAAYFERYSGVWHHGDLAVHTADDAFVIQGRSDAVLNPGGVRIGTAEIYRQVEKVPEVLECVAVGQRLRDGDERVVLFVVPAAGVVLDAALEARIRGTIRANASPRHVPAKILAVPDLPRTRNGKLAETAVRDALHGRAVANVDALANPECLAAFRDLPALQDDAGA